MTGWLLVGVLVAWQYPHFMAIAWLYRRQYGEAGFQMSTTVDPSGRSAAIQSIAGSIWADRLCDGFVLDSSRVEGGNACQLGCSFERMADASGIASIRRCSRGYAARRLVAKVSVGTARGVRHRHRAIDLVSQRVNGPGRFSPEPVCLVSDVHHRYGEHGVPCRA